jgi:hypothetical protein
MPHQYREFEALKRYQHKRELWGTKLMRRARGEDRGHNTRHHLLLPLHQVIYAPYAIYFSFFTPQERRIRQGLGISTERAEVAGQLYNACTHIGNDLAVEWINVSADNTNFFIGNALNRIFDIMQSSIFDADPISQRRESKKLKTLALQAFIKTIHLLNEHTIARPFFSQPLFCTAITNIVNKFSQEDIIRNAGILEMLSPAPVPVNNTQPVFSGNTSLPSYTLKQFADDLDRNLLKPHTISQIALKLGAIHTITLQLTEEKISETIDEFLVATNQDINVINKSFITSLMSSKLGPEFRNMSLKGYLSDEDTFIERTIAAVAQHRFDKQYGLVLSSSELRNHSAKNEDIIAAFKEKRLNKRLPHLYKGGSATLFNNSEKEHAARKQREFDMKWALVPFVPKR